MRILLTYNLVGRGGDALQIQALARAFSDLGHDVTLIGATPLAPYAFGASAGRLRRIARRLPWWGKDVFDLAAQVRLLATARSVLRRNSFAVVFHRGSIYDLVGARIADICPVIAHLDAPFAVEREYRGDGYFKRAHRRSMRSLGQKASLILTPSQAARDYYVDMGIPKDKILIMPNGISKAELASARELATTRAPFSSPPPWILGFVGSLSRWHRVDMLLQALHQLNAVHPARFRLRIVGRGEEYKRLQSLDIELGIGDSVEWVGAIPHEEVFGQISTFDIGMLPSTLNTGAPMKLFEYAAVARPIIAPDLPNIRDLFSTGEMCFFSPEDPDAMAQAILDLAASPEAARRMGTQARAKMQDFTWENILEGVLERFDTRNEP